MTTTGKNRIMIYGPKDDGLACGCSPLLFCWGRFTPRRRQLAEATRNKQRGSAPFGDPSRLKGCTKLTQRETLHWTLHPKPRPHRSGALVCKAARHSTGRPEFQREAERTPKRNRAALSRPIGWAKCLRHSITPSHSAHASIVALDRDGPTATEPSLLVRVTAVASMVPLTVVRLTISRWPSIDPDATRSYVHTLSQTRRRCCNGHRANESQGHQCSRDQHGLSPFPVLCQ